MKKLLLFAVVISGLALTSCAKKTECHCETTSISGETTEEEKETKGTCDELTIEENSKLSNVGSITLCEDH
tara:strand:+ start:759 stop:971 length:213 start_codon:yes stop_codon:yes gene_type:complete